jgi:DNA-binding CsgD family transcriptional regulator
MPKVVATYQRFCGYCGARSCNCSKPANSLTKKEMEIVRKLTEGESNKAIGAFLGMSTETVKRHLANVFDKTGASSRLELAIWLISDDYENKIAVLEKEIEALKNERKSKAVSTSN